MEIKKSVKDANNKPAKKLNIDRNPTGKAKHILLKTFVAGVITAVVSLLIFPSCTGFGCLTIDIQYIFYGTLGFSVGSLLALATLLWHHGVGNNRKYLYAVPIILILTVLALSFITPR